MRYLLVIYLLSISFSVSSQSPLSEGNYSDYIQSLIGGEREVSIKSGRVDLLTSTHAYEIERANKWKQSIGQSIWYGLQTNKKPGIILLVIKKTDYKYFVQLNSALNYAGLSDNIDVFEFPKDFQALIQKSKNQDDN